MQGASKCPLTLRWRIRRHSLRALVPNRAVHGFLHGKRRIAVVRLVNHVSDLGQEAGHQTADVVIVVDHQNAFGMSAFGGGLRFGGRLGAGDRPAK